MPFVSCEEKKIGLKIKRFGKPTKKATVWIKNGKKMDLVSGKQENQIKKMPRFFSLGLLLCEQACCRYLVALLEPQHRFNPNASSSFLFFFLSFSRYVCDLPFYFAIMTTYFGCFHLKSSSSWICYLWMCRSAMKHVEEAGEWRRPSSFSSGHNTNFALIFGSSAANVFVCGIFHSTRHSFQPYIFFSCVCNIHIYRWVKFSVFFLCRHS